MKKYMIVTHTDLDGIRAIVIGKTILNKQHIDMKFCGYHNYGQLGLGDTTYRNTITNIPRGI